MDRFAEKRRQRPAIVCGLLAMLSCLTLCGCAAWQEANNDLREVWTGTANLLNPSHVGTVSPRAVEIDRRLQAQTIE